MKQLLACLLAFATTGGASAQSVFDSLYAANTLDVHFSSGKAELDPSALAVMDSVLKYFASINTEKIIRITAHTDSVGRTDQNENLARRRAAAVTTWLEKHQVPRTAIVSVQTFGERAPLKSNATEDGRWRNRRATIEVARIVPMTTLTGRITDQQTGKGLESTLLFRSKTRQDSLRTDTSGHYSVQLPKDSIIKIEAIARNYFFESVAMKMFGGPELYQKYKLSPNIQLPPAKPGDKAVLRDLFFVGDQARLLKVSEPELPKILRFMQLNNDLIIEIGGHVNVPYPSNHHFRLAPGQTPADYAMKQEEAWKQGLSLSRAETVYRFLLQNGIDKSRMKTKGYQNSEMLFPHASNAKQQEQNRRVEIKVLGKVGSIAE